MNTNRDYTSQIDESTARVNNLISNINREEPVKIKIKSIEIVRAEGFNSKDRKPESTAQSMAQADDIFRLWGRSAPALGHGYHKCDFKITFEDGETYEGRYDLTNDGLSDGETLAQHVRNHVQFYAGTRKPAHLKQEQYDAFLKSTTTEASREECKTWLNTYDIEIALDNKY